jgi:hypothetical protein
LRSLVLGEEVEVQKAISQMRLGLVVGVEVL